MYVCKVFTLTTHHIWQMYASTNKKEGTLFMFAFGYCCIQPIYNLAPLH